MTKIFWFVLLFASVNCYHIDNRTITKLRISGDEYDNVRNIPYMAQILFAKKLLCGGTIIGEYWILTAAHCFDDQGDRTGFAILTGTSRKEGSDGQLHYIKQIYKNKNYNQRDPDADNDIALVQLREPIKFSKVQKAISIRRTPPMVGEDIKIAGFGIVNKKQETSPILKSSEVPVINTQTCQGFFKGSITNNMFCAGTGESDACEGDSGGPATINDELVGVISTGAMCATGHYPGVYTKVYNYIDWIEKWSGSGSRYEKPYHPEDQPEREPPAHPTELPKHEPPPKEHYPKPPREHDQNPHNEHYPKPPREHYPKPPKEYYPKPPKVYPPKVPRPPPVPVPPVPPMPDYLKDFPKKAPFLHEIRQTMAEMQQVSQSAQYMNMQGRELLHQVLYV